MSQPATAGIIVGVIFAVPLFLYFSWKGYLRYRRYKQFQSTSPIDPLPPIRDPTAVAYTNPMRDGNHNSPNLTPYGTWRDSVSKNSLGGSSIFNGLDGAAAGGQRSRRGSSNQGLISPMNGSIYGNGLNVNGGGSGGHPSTGGMDSTSTSAPASPLGSTQAVDLASPTSALSIPNESYYDHSRGISSSSSTMTLKRAYGMNSSQSGSNNPYEQSSTGGRRRESYLPHSPLNRDSIQIIPPQPLGFGFGGLATATDQKTLAFSKSSGVGSNEEWSTGLVWSSGGDNNIDRPSSAARVAEEQRLRYLLQGPGAGGNGKLSPSNNGSTNTSRSRSPAQRSNTNSSDINDQNSSTSSSIRRKELERIEATYGGGGGQGLVKPVARHPLDHNGLGDDNLSSSFTSSNGDGSRQSSSHGGNSKGKGKFNPNQSLSNSSSATSDLSNQHQSSVNGNHLQHQINERNSQIFTSQQSPLQQWSSSSHNKDSQHSSPRNQKLDLLNRPSSSGTNGSDGSPILSAFRVGGGGGQNGNGNSSIGQYDSRSTTNNTSLESSSRSEEVSGPHQNSSPRNKAMVLGKDGKMTLKDLESQGEERNQEVDQESTQRKGWGISSLLGR